ncbi:MULTISPECIES: acyl-CoA carboxylase subunit epsilon [unclassified Streptomyces]|uniref:acyl-CoA carboxylase subunit epsilon n=1 Tax=unclassified Streptomyces TaxID=2593676 RepID=UPI001446E424|nr:acyl-CoA carboxylase subunit epsilon [Streptomyces sp. A1136]
MSGNDPGRFIRSLRGRPDTRELAALTAVVLARAAAYEGRYGGTAGAGPAPASRHRPERRRAFGGGPDRRDDCAADPRPIGPGVRGVPHPAASPAPPTLADN